ncbi:hypothetical protein PIB30_046989 [Stylosanthes scabra]|uniref:Uncharacterized protein n=1 Tax=Stylosanthes scabra TaxID=79078 RepID=A0ABU6WK10_9FABA|nr:hypothetical protein [Stylosanthes scabra]
MLVRERFWLHLPCLWTSMRKKDYLRYIEELRRHPELSPLRSRQASVSDSPRSQLIICLLVITLRVMIFLEFGNRHCRLDIPSSPYDHSGRHEIAETLNSNNPEEYFADFPSLNLTTRGNPTRHSGFTFLTHVAYNSLQPNPLFYPYGNQTTLPSPTDPELAPDNHHLYFPEDQSSGPDRRASSPLDRSET